MIDLSFSLYDLEYFLLVFVRITCFVHSAPFFSMNNTPTQVRVAISLFTSVLLYGTLSPADVVIYETVMEYAVIVAKEMVTGLLLGYGCSMCSAIVNFAGSVADMETGLSMTTLMDPATRSSISITGAYYQYVMMLILIVSGLYRYLLGALADSFVLIPVNGAVFATDHLLSSMVKFMSTYLIIGFRICLPIFCTMLLLNAILGIMAKVSPQMNMFAVGIQLKVMVGLAILFFTVAMLPDATSMIFTEMKRMTVSFVEGMM